MPITVESSTPWPTSCVTTCYEASTPRALSFWQTSSNIRVCAKERPATCPFTTGFIDVQRIGPITCLEPAAEINRLGHSLDSDQRIQGQTTVRTPHCLILSGQVCPIRQWLLREVVDWITMVYEIDSKSEVQSKQGTRRATCNSNGQVRQQATWYCMVQTNDIFCKITGTTEPASMSIYLPCWQTWTLFVEHLSPLNTTIYCALHSTLSLSSHLLKSKLPRLGTGCQGWPSWLTADLEYSHGAGSQHDRGSWGQQPTWLRIMG